MKVKAKRLTKKSYKAEGRLKLKKGTEGAILLGGKRESNVRVRRRDFQVCLGLGTTRGFPLGSSFFFSYCLVYPWLVLKTIHEVCNLDLLLH